MKKFTIKKLNDEFIKKWFNNKEWNINTNWEKIKNKISFGNIETDKDIHFMNADLPLDQRLKLAEEKADEMINSVKQALDKE